MHVSLKTLRKAMCLLDELEEVDPAEAPKTILPGLAELVGSDAATYNEFDAQDRLDYYTDYPAGSHDPALWPMFNAHSDEHPLIAHFSNGKNAQEPAKISDFVSHQQFHDTGLYSEVFRVLPAEDEMAFTVRRETSSSSPYHATAPAGTSPRSIVTCSVPQWVR